MTAVGVLLSALLVPAALRADDEGSGEPAASRAVRLSYVEGNVHLVQGGQVLADQALINTPLFENSQIVTGSDGRAEVQFEDGSVARLSPESSLTISVLRGGNGASRESEVRLNSGLGYFELQGTDGNVLRIRLEDSAVTATGLAVVRVNLDSKPGALAVFSGNVHIEGKDNFALDVHGGESLSLNAHDPNAYNLSEMIEPDSWDAWNADRDQALNQASAERTPASSAMPDNGNPAWNDLDASGNWYQVPDQGYVWSPYEASSPDWDPYGSGSWMWNPGYGYGWVSAEPWGYMPYQCGAWNYYSSFGWGWAPGGCQPWWGGGMTTGWVVNIRTAPPRYRFPVPPRPRNPRPGEGLRAFGGHPVIPVTRRLDPVDTTLPTRDRNATAFIGGRIAEPLRPVEVVRTPYNDHSIPVLGNRPTPGAGLMSPLGRPGYVVQAPSANRPLPPAGMAPHAPQGGVISRPAAPFHNAAPSVPASRPSAPAAHPSGGGGGHPSGGGGGGSPHPSGSPHR